MDIKIDACSFSLYEQMRRLPDGTITLANTEYTRNYIKECEAALCFKDKYYKGEIKCQEEKEDALKIAIKNLRKQALLKKLKVKMEELQAIAKELEELEKEK